MKEMHLSYPNKKTKKQILDTRISSTIKPAHIITDAIQSNMLLKGDNFNMLNILLKDFNLTGKIDLVYIDPPFSTNNVFRGGEGRFNSISSTRDSQIAYSDNLQGYQFLEFLRTRLFLIKELMSNTASIYLHIDYKIGHYVKIIMDEVFGINNFHNDIARIKCNPKNFQRKAFGNVKDLILFYTKTDKYVWNEPLEGMSAHQIEKLFNKIDKNGKRYTTNPLHAPGETKNGKSGEEWKGMLPPKGRHWRNSPEVLDDLDSRGLIEWSANGVPRKIIYAEDYGKKRMQDIWEFKDPQNPKYPTEKNLDMLKTIIETSSTEGQYVMDCFCGSGSTLLAASMLNRKWIGIDSSDLAIEICKRRFLNNDLDLFQNSEYVFYEET